jgi:hypothetical protein
MVSVALYEHAQFEPLIDEPWVPARVEDAIAAIVSDADAVFDLDALWPAEEWDGWEEPLPLKSVYVGAAGVIWALDALRRRGHAETSLDLAAAASPSTPSPKRSGSPPRTAGAATHCSPGTLALHSSPPPAWTSTRAIRSSTSRRAPTTAIGAVCR